jgi:hypothetical protein
LLYFLVKNFQKFLHYKVKKEKFLTGKMIENNIIEIPDDIIFIKSIQPEYNFLSGYDIILNRLCLHILYFFKLITVNPLYPESTFIHQL